MKLYTELYTELCTRFYIGKLYVGRLYREALQDAIRRALQDTWCRLCKTLDVGSARRLM